MNECFLRTEMMLGREAMERLSQCHVAVFGLGGVGSWCAEALCRSGVGELTLIDQDSISHSNLNRQAIALHSTLGQDKAAAAAHRMRDINPDCVLHPIPMRYEAANREFFFSTPYDYIVDAIDLVSCKLDLIESAHLRDIPIISALGTGNKLDPTRLQLSDISKTSGCPLARVVRRELKQRGIGRHKVVFSPEEAHKPLDCGETPPPGRRSIPASVIWVPASAGLLLASAVVEDLLGGWPC